MFLRQANFRITKSDFWNRELFLQQKKKKKKKKKSDYRIGYDLFGLVNLLAKESLD